MLIGVSYKQVLQGESTTNHTVPATRLIVVEPIEMALIFFADGFLGVDAS